MKLKELGRFLLEAATWKDEDYFLQAVADGDAAQVQRLLKTGKNVDPEARYSDGYTPLMVAVANGHLGVAEILLERGAKVNARNNNGETALHRAIREVNPAAVQLLLSYGANASMKGQHGATPRLLAAFFGSEEIFANLDPSPTDSETHLRLMLAAARGDLQDLEAMLNNEVDPNVGATTGFTALLAACYHSQEETATSLLGRGADVNIRTRNGRSALMFAARDGNHRLIQLLTSKGAVVGVRDVEG